MVDDFSEFPYMNSSDFLEEKQLCPENKSMCPQRASNLPNLAILISFLYS